MNTGSARKFVNSFTVALAVVCAVYVALLLGTALALNHDQALHLGDFKIGRIWLPANYSPDDGYEVPVNVILRDMRSELLFGHIGGIGLDLLAVLGLFCVTLRVIVRLIERYNRSLILEARVSPNAAMRPPLGKAAPYGDTRPRGRPGKVLSFPKR